MKHTPVYQLVIVGYGGMGSYHAKHLIQDNPNIEVAGTFDILEERRAVSGTDGYRVYESYEAVLADKNVDIVLIATPNDVHRQLSVDALRAGKHVICEKPVTIYSHEFVDIMAVAKETGKHFIVHQNRRWDEDFLTIKRIYEDNLIGDVYHLESRVQGANGIPGDWRKLKAPGGGMLLDWGVHLLDQLLYMIDSRITRIYSNLSFVLGNEVDDGFQSVLTFENGVTALVEVGTTNYIQLPRWYVKGTTGNAVIEDWSLKGRMVTQNTGVEVEAPKPIRAGQGLTKTMAPPSEQATTTSPLPTAQSTAEGFYENVVSVLEGRGEPVIKNEEVLRVLRLIEAIFRSAETNTVIKDFE